jgi:hypothetical protein
MLSHIDQAEINSMNAKKQNTLILKDWKFKLYHQSPKCFKHLKFMITTLGGEVDEEYGIYITNINTQSKQCTPLWLEHVFKYQKLYDIKYYSPDPTKFCSGWIVYGHKLVQSDLQSLYGGVEAFGGQWRSKQTPDVTHLVTYSDQDEVCQLALKNNIKVLCPEFFDDCFRLGQSCKDTHYLFPEPNIYKLDLKQMLTISKSNSQVELAEDDDMFLEHHVVYMDPEWIIDEQYPIWSQPILKFGAVFTSALQNATIVITEYKSSIFHRVISF